MDSAIWPAFARACVATPPHSRRRSRHFRGITGFAGHYRSIFHSTPLSAFIAGIFHFHVPGRPAFQFPAPLPPAPARLYSFIPALPVPIVQAGFRLFRIPGSLGIGPGVRRHHRSVPSGRIRSPGHSGRSHSAFHRQASGGSGAGGGTGAIYIWIWHGPTTSGIWAGRLGRASAGLGPGAGPGPGLPGHLGLARASGSGIWHPGLAHSDTWGIWAGPGIWPDHRAGHLGIRARRRAGPALI